MRFDEEWVLCQITNLHQILSKVCLLDKTSTNHKSIERFALSQD